MSTTSERQPPGGVGQKGSEEALRQIQLIVENSHDAIMGETLDGIVTAWNGGATRMFGYTPEEIIGKPITVLVPPEFRDEVPALLAKISAGEVVIDHDSVRLHKDGTRIDVALSISPVKSEGTVIGASVVERDITSRKKAERSVEELADKLRESLDDMEDKVTARTVEIEELSKKNEVLLESIGDGLVAIDNNWNITLWNPAAERITGWSKEEAIGQTFRSIVRFVRRSDRSEYVRFISDAMLDGKAHSMEIGAMVVRKDGTEADVSDIAAPIIDENGSVKGVIVVFRDTSKERELERSKDDLVALVTHELRGPATDIAAATSMLMDELKGYPSAAVQAYLAKIGSSNARLSELADSLLDVFRVQFGEFLISPEPADVTQIGESILKQMERQIAEKKLRLEKVYDEGLPDVNVDKRLTELVFSNLFSNAVKYTPDGGMVRLEVRKSGSDLLIAVSDTGLGIPKAEEAKIFGNFYRASNTRAVKGIGVGLHVVKAMLERAGCKIWFTSEENKGTTFSVTIPLTGMSKVAR